MRSSYSPRDAKETVIRANAPRLSVQNVRELIQYRDVAAAFASRYIRVKYKQTVIGLGWAVILPFVTALTLAVLLGRAVHVASEGVPYFAFALTGLVPWMFFSTGISVSLDSIIRDQGLLRKVYFPREILPLSTVLASLVDLGPALLLLFVATAVEGSHFGAPWLLIPVPLLVLCATVLAGSLVVSAANVLYRDVRYAVPFLLQFGLIASPVAYSAQAIGNRALQIGYETLNPIAGVIDAMRRILLHGEPPDWLPFTLAATWSFLTLLAAYYFFRRLERRFADRV